MNFRKLGALAALLLALAAPANGGIVDQSSISDTSIGTVLAEGFAYVGQTVTAGISGNLIRVELDAIRTPDFLTPWELDIQQVSSGVPTGVVLSSTTIEPQDFPTTFAFGPPLGLAVDLSTPIFFSAGDAFAIVLHPQGATGSPGLNAGVWQGSISPNAYQGGVAVTGFDSNNLLPYYQYFQGEPATFDLAFRTIVAPVPEPGGLLLAISGALFLWTTLRKAPRSFRRQTP